MPRQDLANTSPLDGGGASRVLHGQHRPAYAGSLLGRAAGLGVSGLGVSGVRISSVAAARSGRAFCEEPLEEFRKRGHIGFHLARINSLKLARGIRQQKDQGR